MSAWRRTMPAALHINPVSSRRLSATQAAAEAGSGRGAAVPEKSAEPAAERRAAAAARRACSACATEGPTARLANTSPSSRELEARRLAPCRPLRGGGARVGRRWVRVMGEQPC